MLSQHVLFSPTLIPNAKSGYRLGCYTIDVIDAQKYRRRRHNIYNSLGRQSAIGTCTGTVHNVYRNGWTENQNKLEQSDRLSYHQVHYIITFEFDRLLGSGAYTLSAT